MAIPNVFHHAQIGPRRGLVSWLKQEEKGWKKIWAVHAQQKKNIILWRLAHDCLLTGFQLNRRHISASVSCIFVTGWRQLHLSFLWLCRWIWEGIKATYGITLCHRFFRNPRQLLFDILMRSTDTQATAITITIWHIWEAEWCKKWWRFFTSKANCREDASLCGHGNRALCQSAPCCSV
jgi:hypothetical protein